MKYLGAKFNFILMTVLTMSAALLMSFKVQAETPGFDTDTQCYNYIAEEGLNDVLSENLQRDVCSGTGRHLYMREAVDYWGCVFRPEFSGGQYYPVHMMTTVSTRSMWSTSGYDRTGTLRCTSTPYESSFAVFYYNGYGGNLKSELTLRFPVLAANTPADKRATGFSVYWKDTRVRNSRTTTAGTTIDPDLIYPGKVGVVNWAGEN